MKRLKNWLVPDWYQMILLMVGLFFVGLLLWFQLGTLTPGLSETETTQSHAITSLQDIWTDPLNFPYKILQFGFNKLDTPVPAVRVASTLVGLIVAGSFFYVLRSWYSRRVAVLGALLFVSSAWFLHTARLGTEGIMYALPITIVAATIWLQRTRGKTLAVVAGMLLAVILLYSPGMIWLIVPLALWQFSSITRFLMTLHPAAISLLVLMGFAAIAPLALAFYQEPALLRVYLGAPETLPAPLEFMKNLANVPIMVLFRGPDAPEAWLGRLPLLTWFSITMLIIGCYGFWRKRRLDRVKFVAYILVVGAILTAAGGAVTVSILLPFIYLLAASGIAFMLQQWFTVFPKNPVARTFGPTLMTVAILMASYYNINQYFIAWPNTPETKAAFTQTTDTE